MRSRPEGAQIRAEVESAWRDSGIPVEPDQNALPTGEAKWLREQAMGIIQGDMDPDQLSSLTPALTRKLSAVTQELIGLTTAASIQELTAVNPRYSAFQAKVVKDTTRKAENSQ
jgi:hypothetical protein